MSGSVSKSYSFRLDPRDPEQKRIAGILDGWIAEVKQENPDHGAKQVIVPLLLRYLNDDKPYKPARETKRDRQMEEIDRKIEMLVELIKALKANGGAVMQQIADADEGDITDDFVSGVVLGMTRA